MINQEKIILVKIGGSVLTDATFSINHDLVIRVCRTLEALSGAPLIFVHGLGTYGRAVLPLYQNNVIQECEFALARYVQNSLRSLHDQLLIALSKSFRVRGFDPESIFLPSVGSELTFYGDGVRASLNRRELPVLYGGTIRNADGNFTIVSSDAIMREVGLRFAPRSFALWACDVHGVLNTDKETIRTLTPESFEQMWKPESSDPTRAMYGKVLECITLAKGGVDSVIFSESDFFELSQYICQGAESTDVRWTDVRSVDWQ